MHPNDVEDVWRHESPHVLAALLRRHGDLADCEDAAQEAAEAAARQWPRDGVPDNPRGWLVRVASRRLIDRVRADLARAAREEAVGRREAAADLVPAADAGVDADADRDDSLLLLLLCCHPSLSRPSQVALTLRSVAGLTAAQVAAAYLVPEPTMKQRLVRARATLREAGARFEPARARGPAGTGRGRARRLPPHVHRGLHPQRRDRAWSTPRSQRRRSGSPGCCGPPSRTTTR